MNIWIKRSLAVMAVSGGLVIAGAAAATADDTSPISTSTSSSDSASDSASDSGTAFSAPVEVGGVNAGVEQEQSQSDSSSSTTTDEDGTSSSSESTSDRTADSAGVQTGSVTADPSAARAQQQEQDSDRTGSSGGSGSSGSSDDASAQQGAAQAPVHVGGVQAGGQRDTASSEERSSQVSDEDGTRSSTSRSEESRSTGGTIGSGDLNVDPNGFFAQSEKSASDRVGDDDAGIASDESSTQRSFDAAAPYSFDGFVLGFHDDQASSQSDTSSVTDEQGTRSSSTWSQDASSTDGGFVFGELSGNPAGSFDDNRSEESQQVGDDISSEESSSRTQSQLSGPFAFDGAAGGLAQESRNAEGRESSVTDEDGTRSSSEGSSTETAREVGGASGAFTGAPSAGFLDERSDRSERVGESTYDESDSRQVGGYAFPYEYDGFTAFARSLQADQEDSSSTVRDEDGTRSSTDSFSSQDEQRPTFGFDRLAGDPAGAFDSDDMNDTSEN